MTREAGLVDSCSRYDCIRDVGMVQNNNGDWIAVHNYKNLSRQLDNAVDEIVELKTVGRKEIWNAAIEAAAKEAENLFPGTVRGTHEYYMKQEIADAIRKLKEG